MLHNVQRRKHQPWALFARHFHNLVFKLLSFPEGMFRAQNRGTATAQARASDLRPQPYLRGGSGSPRTAISAPLLLFSALHRVSVSGGVYSVYGMQTLLPYMGSVNTKTPYIVS